MRKLFNEFKSWKKNDARRTEYLAMVIGAVFACLILFTVWALQNVFDTPLLIAISAIVIGKFGAVCSKFVLFLLCRKSK